MARQDPGMRNMICRQQQSRLRGGQRIYDASSKWLCDTEHLSASGVAAVVDACCSAAETNILTPHLDARFVTLNLTRIFAVVKSY